MRIAVHDYAGHPFPYELSRALAGRGHTVGHFYFAGDMGPKGEAVRRPGDPESFAVFPITTGEAYSKTNLVQRRRGDILYGRATEAALRAFRPDVVISGNTPLEAQSRIISGVHDMGAAFVFWMQDFYSIATQRILGRRLPGIGHLFGYYYKRLEAAQLNASDGIVVISTDFIACLRELGVQREVTVIENWGPMDSIPARPKDNPWAARHGLTDKLVFLYSGTMALKHDPEPLWRLAEAFRGRDDVRVVIAAAGVNADALRARHAADPHPNLLILPLQPIGDLADMLGAADVLVAQLEADAGQFSVPSKVLSYLCAGRPILLAAPPANLAFRTVEACGAGVCVASDDTAGLIAAAQKLAGDEALRLRAGAAGRAYAEATFQIPAITDRFEAVFAEAVAARAGGGRKAV
jgi:colanic acid biosynthesis glycosyl transferase WcaI